MDKGLRQEDAARYDNQLLLDILNCAYRVSYRMGYDAVCADLLNKVIYKYWDRSDILTKEKLDILETKRKEIKDG